MVFSDQRRSRQAHQQAQPIVSARRLVVFLLVAGPASNRLIALAGVLLGAAVLDAPVAWATTAASCGAADKIKAGGQSPARR
jgi:hypothetical protein